MKRKQPSVVVNTKNQVKKSSSSRDVDINGSEQEEKTISTESAVRVFDSKAGPVGVLVAEEKSIGPHFNACVSIDAAEEGPSIVHDSGILDPHDACAVSSISNDQERVVLLSVVDWSGEERAKLAVRGSDSVLHGQLQIKEQTGVEISAQRLVLGEVELKPSMTWGSITGLQDGTTVQLTVVIDVVYDAETDRAALEVLWSYLNWRPDRPVSEGRYMRFNEEGRITYLNLFAKKLGGTIPPEIGNLTALSFLSLGGNRLTGEIPQEVGNLTALTGLYLQANELTGSIPREIGNLTALQVLRIHRNKLSGDIPELGNLTQLREIYLSSNMLTGMIPSELSNLTGLTGLDLQSNRLLNGPDHRLHGKDLSFFLEGLSEIQSRSSPSILGSSASSIVPRKKRKAESIPRSGDQASCVGGARCGGGGVVVSFDAAGEEPSISPQSSSNPHDACAVILSTGDEVGTTPHPATSVTAVDPAESVVNVRYLIVYISVVDWSGEERARLAVRGSDSVLHGQLQIKEQTGVETSAQRLVLGEVELKASMTWGSIPGWRDGSTVQLTVVDDDEFNAVSDWTTLMAMYIEWRASSGCFRDGRLAGWGGSDPISSWYGVTVNGEGRVTHLNLAGKRIHGLILPEIGNLTELVVCDFSDNGMRGDIPIEIGNLSKLTLLQLCDNQLSGSIPESIGNLRSLEFFTVERNNLSGRIPPEVIALRAMIEIDGYHRDPVGGGLVPNHPHRYSRRGRLFVD